MDIVFLHGAGEGAHAEDSAMAHSLVRHLGEGTRLHAPELPRPDDPTPERWGPVIGRAIEDAAEPVVIVAHSFSGPLLIRHLVEHPPTRRISSIHLLASPIPGGDDDWTWDGFELPDGFPEELPDAPVFLSASEDDEWVPFAHRDLWAAAIPGAQTRTRTGGHQFGDDLRGVADDIRATFH